MSNQSNTFPAPQRIFDFVRYNLADQRDWLNYKVVGRKFHFQLWPALDSEFPTIQIEKEPLVIQNSSPLIHAFRTYSEFKGERYQIITLLFSNGSFFKDDTAWIVYAFQNGKQIHTVQFPGGMGEVGAAMAVLLDMDYQKNAKEIPQSKIKTTILDFDMDTMQRSYVASIAADGLPAFEKTGDALDLRKKGVNLTNFQYFKWARIWEIGQWKAIITERHDGRFEYMLSDQNGQRPTNANYNTHAQSLVPLLVSAFDAWKNAPNPK